MPKFPEIARHIAILIVGLAVNLQVTLSASAAQIRGPYQNGTLDSLRASSASTQPPRRSLVASVLSSFPAPGARRVCWQEEPASPAAKRTANGVTVADPGLRRSLGEIQQLIGKGDSAGARALLAQALKQFPNEPALYNFMGAVEVQSGNYQAAELNFQKTVEKSPRYAIAYLNLGRLYQQHADKIPQAEKKALETYERLLKFDPENVEANYQSAFLLQLQGSFKSSLERLARLPADAQGIAQALALRCADYAGLEERAPAESAAQELSQRADLSEANVISIMPVLEKHHRQDLETKLLAALAEHKLASPAALYRLGVLYESQQEYPQARETLEKVSEQQPDAVPPLIELARVASNQGDNQSALGYLAHARDLQPANAAIHYSFGLICYKEGLPAEAYRSLKKAVTLEPNNPSYNYAFASVAYERLDPRECIPYFKKYVELEPGDPGGRLALGAAYVHNHDDEQARRILEGVVNTPQIASGAHYFLGLVAHNQGRPDDAVKELRQALALQPGFTDGWVEIGLVYLKQKRYPEAEKSLRRAIDLDPESFSANLNLMILYQRTKDPRASEQAMRFEKIRADHDEWVKGFKRTIEVLR